MGVDKGPQLAVCPTLSPVPIGPASTGLGGSEVNYRAPSFLPSETIHLWQNRSFHADHFHFH